MTDFLKVLQEIRGTGAPEVEPTDGMYWDLTIALTGVNGASGKYGHMLEMYNNLNGPTGSYTDFVAKYDDFLNKYGDIVDQLNIATTAATDAVTAQGLAEDARDLAGISATAAGTSNQGVRDSLDLVQGNGKTVEVNLNDVASDSINIGTVAAISQDVSEVASIAGDVTDVKSNATDITSVASNINSVNKVADVDAEVTVLAAIQSSVVAVATVKDELIVIADEPMRTSVLNAGANANKAELEAWEAQAEKMTAKSYSNEAPNTFVKFWTSDGNGGFNYFDTDEYSALHYTKINKGINKLIGFFDASTALTFPQDGDDGEMYQISVAGDVNGTVVPPLAVGDELRWDDTNTQWAIVRHTIPYTMVLDVPENVSNAQSRSEKGVADGYVPLNASTLIDATYLPSYVDDVLEVNTHADLPTTGETGKIYIVVADETLGNDTSTYRWSGSTYALISDIMTPEDIKAIYESNANTNEFDDAEKVKLADTEITSQLDDRDTANRNTDNHTDGIVNGVYLLDERSKLAGIEDNATGDQTDAEIKTAYENNANTNEYSDAEKEKVSHISITQAVDLDTVESDTALNNTHRGSTGEDHGFIDQDVTAASDPTFNSVIVTTTVDGRDISVDGAKLDTIEDNAKDDQTATEIETLYEGIGNTNKFTDVDKYDVNAVNMNAAKELAAMDIVSMAYDTSGNLNTITYTGTGNSEVFSYNASDSLSNIEHTLNGVVAGNTDLSYDVDGNLISVVFTAS